MERMSVFVISLLLVQIVSVVGYPIAPVEFTPSQSDQAESGELLSDPFLTIEPDFEIGYGSPEFSYEYEVGSSGGKATLVWTHTAGYELNYGYGGYDDCNEYVRVSQGFTWTYNQTPMCLKISSSLDIASTGDFAGNESGNDMWDIVYWIHVPGYSMASEVKEIQDFKNGENTDFNFLLDRQICGALFEGSVETEGGDQYYPNDDYILYMGLRPSYLFGGNPDALEYWNSYSGSVVVTVDFLSIKALLDANTENPIEIQPKYNTTSIWNETFYGSNIEYVGQESLLCTSSSYDTIVVSLLTEDHKSLWNRSFNSENNFYPMTCVSDDKDFIIIGVAVNESSYYYDLFVMKMNREGQTLWNFTYTFYDLDYPTAAAVDNEGNIIIGFISYLIYETDFRLVNSLLKLNRDGLKIWNKTIHVSTYEEYISHAFLDMIMTGIGCYGSDIIVGFTREIVEYDSEGDILWQADCNIQSFSIDPLGGFYTSSIMHEETCVISRWNAAGSIVWTKEIGIEYLPGWSDRPETVIMKADETGTLWILAHYAKIDLKYTILRILRNGQTISQNAIYNYDDSDDPFGEILYMRQIEPGSNGRVHIFGFKYDNEYNQRTFLLLYEYAPRYAINPLSLIIGGAAGIIFLGIAVDYFILRKRRVESLKVTSQLGSDW